jgi:hypothetical protein
MNTGQNHCFNHKNQDKSRNQTFSCELLLQGDFLYDLRWDGMMKNSVHTEPDYPAIIPDTLTHKFSNLTSVDRWHNENAR